jgi:CMP-N,N'-diacetyllegionaminic acid synthase
MINKKRILCIVTARKNSKGLKNKNIKKINGKELFLWPLYAAKKSQYIDEIIISTDSEKIISIAKKNNFHAPFKRPARLATDKSSSSDVILHALNFFKNKNINFDYVVILEPTSPLTTTSDIDKAIKLIVKKKTESLVSVCKSERYHPYFHYKLSKKLLLKNFFKKINHVRRQDLPSSYFLDGSIYILRVKYFLKKKKIINNKMTGFVISKIKSFEIDDKIDYEIIKFLKKNENKF